MKVFYLFAGQGLKRPKSRQLHIICSQIVQNHADDAKINFVVLIRFFASSKATTKITTICVSIVTLDKFCLHGKITKASFLTNSLLEFEKR